MSPDLYQFAIGAAILIVPIYLWHCYAMRYQVDRGLVTHAMAGAALLVVGVHLMFAAWSPKHLVEVSDLNGKPLHDVHVKMEGWHGLEIAIAGMVAALEAGASIATGFSKPPKSRKKDGH